MKIQNAKSLMKWQNQMIKHIKRMDNNCHITDLVQAFFKCRKWWIEPGVIVLNLYMTAATGVFKLTVLVISMISNHISIGV